MNYMPFNFVNRLLLKSPFFECKCSCTLFVGTLKHNYWIKSFHRPKGEAFLRKNWSQQWIIIFNQQPNEIHNVLSFQLYWIRSSIRDESLQLWNKASVMCSSSNPEALSVKILWGFSAGIVLYILGRVSEVSHFHSDYYCALELVILVTWHNRQWLSGV